MNIWTPPDAAPPDPRPVYGYYCLSCEQFLGHNSKHPNPATGEKCRDVTGSSSVPSEMSPVAARPWGSRGIHAEREWEADYLNDLCIRAGL